MPIEARFKIASAEVAIRQQRADLALRCSVANPCDAAKPGPYSPRRIGSRSGSRFSRETGSQPVTSRDELSLSFQLTRRSLDPTLKRNGGSEAHVPNEMDRLTLVEAQKA